MSGTELSEEDLDRTLEHHRLWISGDSGGERADLSGTNLQGRILIGLQLPAARFYRADLKGADLSGSDLRWANFVEADLSWADLSGSDLRGCDFRRADLRDANFEGSDMRAALLQGADYDGATCSMRQRQQWEGEVRYPNEE